MSAHPGAERARGVNEVRERDPGPEVLGAHLRPGPAIEHRRIRRAEDGSPQLDVQLLPQLLDAGSLGARQQRPAVRRQCTRDIAGREPIPYDVHIGPYRTGQPVRPWPRHEIIGDPSQP